MDAEKEDWVSRKGAACLLNDLEIARHPGGHSD